MDMTDDNATYKIDRPIYSYDKISKDYHQKTLEFSLLETLKSKAMSSNPSIKSITESVIPFPFIMASFYSWRFLLSDLIAGFTMLIFYIPQGMSYGLLAGLQPINGLYTSFIPPLTYFIFGTSRHLSIGTFTIIAILSSGTTLREAIFDMKVLHNGTLNGSITGVDFGQAEFEIAKLNVAIATSLLAGIFQLAMGFCKLGFLMNYISDSLIEGFTTALSLHVLLSQIGKVLGYAIDRYSGIGEIPYKIYLFCIKITEIHWTTFGLSIGCMVVLILVSEVINPIFQKRFKFPLPTQFILVVVTTIISYYGNIATDYSVTIIGPIPKGLPVVVIPDVRIMPRIVSDAFILAVVAFVMNSALVKIYSLKYSYKVNFNQELVAYGLSNILGSFFQCTMSAGAIGRSSVVAQAGMKSQVASIISSFLMFFVLLFIGPLFQYVPRCVLAVIIIVALKGMVIQLKNVPGLYRTSKYDFNVWIVTFLATIFLNVPLGLTTGFFFSLLTIVIRIQNPEIQVLGQLPKTNIYKDIKCFEEAQEIPKVKIFRFEAPLYFANAESFRSELYRKTNLKSIISCSNTGNESPTGTSNTPGNENVMVPIQYPIEDIEVGQDFEFIDLNEEMKFIILDFGSINYVDKVAIRVLDDILSTTQRLKVSMLIAAPNTNSMEMLQFSKFANGHLDEIMFVTVHDAVLRTLQK